MTYLSALAGVGGLERRLTVDGKQRADEYVAGQAGHPPLRHRPLRGGVAVTRGRLQANSQRDHSQHEDEHRRRM